MKNLFFILFLWCMVLPAAARHVAGGELFYEYVGPALGNASNYRITLRLFRDCASTGPLLENEPVNVGIYSNATNSLVVNLPMPRITDVTTIALNTALFPCLVGNVKVCYEIGIYSAIISLPDNVAGYTLSRAGCCRIDNISNLSVATNVGSNYITKIPGTAVLPEGHNNSPQFFVRDTALVCARKSFRLDFGAFDLDKDSLTYTLCDAYASGTGGNNAPPAAVLSLPSLPYSLGYSGAYPLGPGVTINRTTGIIQGIAPPEGQYVVNVCITEWRKGIAISEHRKDFILKVQNCDFIEAVLPEKIIQCKDSVVHFENLSTSASIESYHWSFGDSYGGTSSNAIVDYAYKDTGTYVATLTVKGPAGCVGSASTIVSVYPGFVPSFTISGSCYLNPFQFNDQTYARYGKVDSWQWDFGDSSTDMDTSSLQNPKHSYPKASTNKVTLIVTSNKGCMDTAYQTLTVADKPQLQLPFRDTLICSVDTLPIRVLNNGNYSWLPDKNILFANTARPLVFPKDTTTYYVTINDNGCINTDSLTVNVLPFITVDLGKDSVICKNDIITLKPKSEALSYQWRASSGEKIADVKNPSVQPMVNTLYYVTANLGKCQDRDSIRINVVPYPVAQAGPDTVICFGNRVQLRSTVVGSSVNWTPVTSLLNPTSPTPIAGPVKSTAYVLRVTDTLGCTKASSDTLLVTVAPQVMANAGNDTAAVPGQKVQLAASGGSRYIWSPETGLDDPSVYNPVTTIDAGADSVKYRVRVYDANGCYGEDDIVIRVFRGGPDILVPSAFTPNGDGKNDILRPLAVGITRLSYFRVYNRWGELLFSTSELGKGWDGYYKGSPQPPGAYVFHAEGADFTGKTVIKKGTAVLIR